MQTPSLFEMLFLFNWCISSRRFELAFVLGKYRKIKHPNIASSQILEHVLHEFSFVPLYSL
jgi:hypothetical protein